MNWILPCSLIRYILFILYNRVLYLHLFIAATHSLGSAWLLKSLKFNTGAWHKSIKIMAKGKHSSWPFRSCFGFDMNLETEVFGSIERVG